MIAWLRRRALLRRARAIVRDTRERNDLQQSLLKVVTVIGSDASRAATAEGVCDDLIQLWPYWSATLDRYRRLDDALIRLRVRLVQRRGFKKVCHV